MAFDPLKHPRGEHGHWARTEGAENEPDPRTMDVGGDEWNIATAKRLEEAYAADRPALNALAAQLTHSGQLDRNYEGIPSTSISEAIAAENAAHPSTVINEAGDEEPYKPHLLGEEPKDEDDEAIPDTWDELTGKLQDEAEEKYKDENFKFALDAEQESWTENNGAAESGHMVAEDDDWRADALSDIVDARAEDSYDHKPEERIPYSADDLYAAVKLEYDADADDGYQHVRPQNVHISFDDSKLQNPDDISHPDPNQMQLPGLPEVEKHDYSTHLTQEMRDDITSSLTQAFVDQAEKKEHMVEPPDYLEESAKEYVTDQWAQMSDEEKFKYVKNETNLLDYYEGLAAGKKDQREKLAADNAPLSMPKKLDPMQVNENSSEYVKTQRLLKAMADQRAVQIMAQRGLVGQDNRSRNFGAYSLDMLKKYESGELLPHKNFGSELLDPDTPPEEQKKQVLDAVKKEIAFREENGRAPVSITSLHDADDKLWEGWKGSSTGNEGRLLQMAVADELGGRIRTAEAPKQEAWMAEGFESPDSYTQYHKNDASNQYAKNPYPPGPHELVSVNAEKPATYSLPIEGIVVKEANDVGHTGWNGVYVPGGLIDGLGDKHHFFKLGKSDPLSEAADTTRLEYNTEKEKVLDGISGVEPLEIHTNGSRGVILNKNGVWVSRNSPEGQNEIDTQKLGDRPTYQNPKILKAEGVIPVDSASRVAAFTRLPDIKLDRNGASSATLDPAVANRWNGTPVYDAKPRDELINQANQDFASIGGYEGIKAAVRAKWEVSQWALDHADMPNLEVYRGLTYHHIPTGDLNTGPVPTGVIKTGPEHGAGGSYGDGLDGQVLEMLDPKTGKKSDLPLNESHMGFSSGGQTYQVLPTSLKPGASSQILVHNQITGKMDPYTPNALLGPKPTGWVTGDKKGFQVQDAKGHMSTVKLDENGVSNLNGQLYMIENGVLKVHKPGGSANDWSPFDPKDRPAPQQERIVLRADVPRTAVVSIPAYGQNIHSEHEVILGGLGWRGWDAWSDHAPTFQQVPMAGVTPSTYDGEPDKTEVDKAAEKAYTVTDEQVKEAADKATKAAADKEAVVSKMLGEKISPVETKEIDDMVKTIKAKKKKAKKK